MTEKNYFASNLRYLRQKKNMEQLELAELLKRKSSSSISEWEKGKYKPKAGILSDIASIFNVTLTDLMEKDLTLQTSTTRPHVELIPSTLQKVTYTTSQLEYKRQLSVLDFAENELTEQLDEQKKEEQPKLPENIIQFEEYRKRVPVNVYFAASAGTGVCQEDNLDMEVMFYEDELAEDYDNVGIVMGSSMEPVFKNGDYIFVKITTDIPNGAISIWQVNGENYVKKFRSNGRPYLESLNPEYDDVELDEDDNIRPLGVVVDVYREN